MDPADEIPEGEVPRSRLRRLGRKLMGEDRIEGRFSARELLENVVEGSDKARVELIKIVAREVRLYLDEFGIRQFLTDYSLEVHASVNLRKLAETEKAPKT